MNWKTIKRQNQKIKSYKLKRRSESDYRKAVFDPGNTE